MEEPAKLDDQVGIKDPECFKTTSLTSDSSPCKSSSSITAATDITAATETANSALTLEEKNSKIRSLSSSDAIDFAARRSLLGYKCERCGRECPTKHKLKRHLSTHSTARPFPCKICGRSFKWSEYLQKHMRLQHRNGKNVEAAVSMFVCKKHPDVVDHVTSSGVQARGSDKEQATVCTLEEDSTDCHSEDILCPYKSPESTVVDTEDQEKLPESTPISSTAVAGQEIDAQGSQISQALTTHSNFTSTFHTGPGYSECGSDIVGTYNQSPSTVLYSGGQPNGSGMFSQCSENRNQPDGSGMYSQCPENRSQPDGSGMYSQCPENRNQPDGSGMYSQCPENRNQPDGSGMYSQCPDSQNQPNGSGMYNQCPEPDGSGMYSQCPENQNQPDGSGMYSQCPENQNQPDGSGMYSDGSGMYSQCPDSQNLPDGSGMYPGNQSHPDGSGMYPGNQSHPDGSGMYPGNQSHPNGSGMYPGNQSLPDGSGMYPGNQSLPDGSGMYSQCPEVSGTYNQNISSSEMQNGITELNAPDSHFVCHGMNNGYSQSYTSQPYSMPVQTSSDPLDLLHNSAHLQYGIGMDNSFQNSYQSGMGNACQSGIGNGFQSEMCQSGMETSGVGNTYQSSGMEIACQSGMENSCQPEMGNTCQSGIENSSHSVPIPLQDPGVYSSQFPDFGTQQFSADMFLQGSDNQYPVVSGDTSDSDKPEVFKVEVGVQCELGPETIVALLEDCEAQDDSEVKEDDMSETSNDTEESKDNKDGHDAEENKDSKDSHGGSKLVQKYPCRVENCDKAYIYRKDVIRHMRIHHGITPQKIEAIIVETPLKPYVCDASGCGRSYYHMKDLKRHQRVAHKINVKPASSPEVNTSSEDREFLQSQFRFPCDFKGCLRSYIHKKDLVRHKRLFHKDASLNPSIPVPVKFTDLELKHLRQKVKQEIDRKEKKMRLDSTGSNISNGCGEESEFKSLNGGEESCTVLLTSSAALQDAASDLDASISKEVASILGAIERHNFR